MSLDGYLNEAELAEMRHLNGAPLMRTLPPHDFIDLHEVRYWRPETIGAHLAKQAMESDPMPMRQQLQELGLLKSEAAEAPAPSGAGLTFSRDLFTDAEIENLERIRRMVR